MLFDCQRLHMLVVVVLTFSGVKAAGMQGEVRWNAYSCTVNKVQPPGIDKEQ